MDANFIDCKYPVKEFTIHENIRWLAKLKPAKDRP